MGTRLVTDCDVCGTVKKESNNWWNVLMNVPVGYLVVSHFDDACSGLVACGRKCVGELVERWMQTGSLDVPQFKDPTIVDYHDFGPTVEILKQAPGESDSEFDARIQREIQRQADLDWQTVTPVVRQPGESEADFEARVMHALTGGAEANAAKGQGQV